MNESTVVYVSGGRIVRHGIYCPPADPGLGELQINCSVTNITAQYVDESQTPPAVADMPPRPSMAHDFDYSMKQWVLNVDEAWRRVRQRRGELLAACDWTQLPDVSDASRSAWAVCRQALRDVTMQPGPTSIVWPDPPA